MKILNPKADAASMLSEGNKFALKFHKDKIMRTTRPFGFAWNGLKIDFSTETNFRIHIFLSVVTLIFGIGLRIFTPKLFELLKSF